ncbi:MAG: adenylate/guanylate cyclase domain-containing protein [Nitrospirae bacterium]|nr:adenylate/guanylate cyclase domain-containing protein [Nitrospirota bacterium]
MKSRPKFYRTTVVLTAVFVLLQWRNPDIIREHLESRTYDFRLALRELIGKPAISGDIVIVAIDEKSLGEIGRWPWGREVMAGLIDKISSGGPRAIGVDVMFTEPENAAADGKLGSSIKKAGNVVLAYPFRVPLGNNKGTKEAVDTEDSLWDSAFMEVKSVKGIPWQKWAVAADRVTLPLAEISQGAAALGHVSIVPDMDGVTRWENMYIKYGDDCYPPLALQVARLSLGLAQKEMTVYGGAGIKLGPVFIPTDLSGRVLINYAGREKTFPYISAADIIKGQAGPGSLKDKIVLLGTTALATYDQKITPLSADMPGVEKNANVVENILTNNFIRPSPGIAEIAVIIITGIFLGLILPRLGALPSAAVAISIISLYILASCYVLIYHGLWINLLYPVLNMLGIFALQTVIRFSREEKKAREIRQMFSSYVSPKIVHELIEHPERAALGGERRLVTILFSDVIGFTSLSEKKRPEDVVALLNEYFKEMTDIIFRWDGTLDKFVGDEIMVFWGAPLDQPDHAERAVRCAVEMSEKLNEMRKTWAEKGVEGLDCGIGINTGEVIIGNIGAEGKKMDYTAIGDHVNLAARVEKLTRQYGTRILITENTYAAIKPVLNQGAIGNCIFQDLASVRVKGKEQEVRIYGSIIADIPISVSKEDSESRKPVSRKAAK